MNGPRFIASCDNFVVLPPATTNGCVIFGKNADRPKSEVQEIIYVAATDHSAEKKLECTYIEIDQATHTHAVILSKPAWTWGAEMGANQHGVCIGNEGVRPKDFGPEALDEKLLGMDLVRLGLERASSAKDALDVITGLIEQHGQGGRCTEDLPDVCYYNSFIIADSQDAWVLETIGQHWAAEKVTGVRNISNQLSIGTKIDAMSAGLQDYARSKGFWDGSGDFDFSSAFSGGQGDIYNEAPDKRFKCGKELLENLSINNDFSLTSMIKILRDQESGICRVGGEIATVASMVSVIPPPGSTVPACHWLTGTPNPGSSVFKPFVFCADVTIGNYTISPSFAEEDPVKIKPRFQKKVDRSHLLYKAHSRIKPLPGNEVDHAVIDTLLNMEAQCIGDMEQFIKEYSPEKQEELRDLFKDVVETEMKIYNIN